MLYWWSLDISESFQLILVTPLVLFTTKAPNFFQMHFGGPLIFIFAKVFEVVDLALPLLL